MVNRFLKGTLILTIAGFIVKAIGSINWILLSRVLGGEGIGIYQMAFPIYMLALNVSSAGIPVAISIITAEKLACQDYKGAQRVFKLAFIFLCLTGLTFSAIMYMSSHWLIDHKIILEQRAYYSLIALSPAIFFVTLLSAFRGYLQGWQLMTPTAISQIVEQLVRVGAMLIAATLLLPRGLEFAAGGASLGAGIGALAALLVLVFYYYRLPKPLPTDSTIIQEPSGKIIKRIVLLAIPISLSSILLPAVANMDLIIVPRRLEVAGFSTGEATELFGYLTGMAVPLINLATILTAALATSLVPTISDAQSRKDKDSIYFRTSGAMRLSFMATIPFSVMLYVLAEPVVSIIYNAPKAAEATQILAIAIFFLGLHQVTTGILQGLGKPTLPVINMMLAASVKILLNWYLVALPWLGIKGAAYATVSDIGFAALLNLFFVKKYTDYFLDAKELSKNIISAAIMGMIMYVTYHFIYSHGSMLLALLTSIVIGTCIYLLLMILLKGLNHRDGERIPFIREWLSKKDNNT